LWSSAISPTKPNTRYMSQTPVSICHRLRRPRRGQQQLMLLCDRNRANHSPLPLGAVTWLGFQMGKIGMPEGLKVLPVPSKPPLGDGMLRALMRRI
jgi:hypothetical protein